MMPAALLVVLALFSWTGTVLSDVATETVIASYGQTIIVPCKGASEHTNNIVFIKWKYEGDDKNPADLLVKRVSSDVVTIQATDSYAQRVSIDNNYSLLVAQASLRDQRTFTCMVVSPSNIKEYPVRIFVHKEPSSVQILDKTEVLLKDKLTTVGTCIAAYSNPAANITWKKDGKLLEADGKAVVKAPSLKLDPATGLSTISSTLQYTASKEDADAVFTCVSTYKMSIQEINLNPFPVHYPSENVTLQVLSRMPIVEGDNVTLKCQGDGNPPPTSFFFHIQGRKTQENSDSYTLASVSREATGEYRCSLTDNEELQDVQNILVNYVDLVLSPSGKVLKMVGENLTVTVEKSTSGEAAVSWTKNGRMIMKPTFNSLTYDDAGEYKCEVSVPGITQQQSFELSVEGKPQITSWTEDIYADNSEMKVLKCEAKAVPEPQFQWSINTTAKIYSDGNGVVTQTIEVLPSTNLSVICNVSNKHGEDYKIINIFVPPSEKRSASAQDQIGVIVGVIVVLLCIVAVGLIYCFYKNWRRGSFRPKNDRNDNKGTPEELTKLENGQNH